MESFVQFQEARMPSEGMLRYRMYQRFLRRSREEHKILDDAYQNAHDEEQDAVSIAEESFGNLGTGRQSE